MRRITLISALVAAMAMLVVAAPMASAKSGGSTQRTIALKGSISFPNATGKATYKVNGSERELDVEAEHMLALAGKHVNVFVNGNKFASPIVGSLGRIHVSHSTEKGQQVPTISNGSTVRVRTLGGTLIASGTF